MVILFLVILALAAGFYFGFIIGFSRAVREAAKQMRSASSWSDRGRFLIGLGFMGLTCSVGAAIYSWNFIRTAQHATGTVIELRQSKDKETDDVTYAPTFAFQDTTGATHKVSTTLFSSPPLHQVGDTVGILYRPGDPQNARIDQFWYHWGLAVILACVGSLTTFLGVGILYVPPITELAKRLRANALRLQSHDTKG